MNHIRDFNDGHLMSVNLIFDNDTVQTRKPDSFYPVNHGDSIIQYDEHVFIWPDETGGLGGGGDTLEQAEQSLKNYVASLSSVEDWSISQLIEELETLANITQLPDTSRKALLRVAKILEVEE